jgi:membrane protein
MARQKPPLSQAIYDTYRDSGFTMASAVAFSFLVSIFPFCIFIGALAATVGGPQLARPAIDQLFQILPQPVASALVPEVQSVMTSTRPELLTLGGVLALFFATGAVETLRIALNTAYRVKETRPYLLCLFFSVLHVVVSAATMLLLAWLTIIGPNLAKDWQPEGLRWLTEASWFSSASRYGIVILVLLVQLLTYHLWLAAGRRSLLSTIPGALFSVLLWVIVGSLYSFYLTFSDYSKFYAGLSQLMVALIFFQVTAAIILIGAELNRGLIELRRPRAHADTEQQAA